MTQAPLDSLCRELAAAFRRDARGGGVTELLARYADEHRDWCEFARFRDETYSRNLVHRDRDYELLLLCWGEGHTSAIHNHAQQSCWMAVLEGDLEEVHYREPALSDAPGSPLVVGRTQRLTAGQVAFIEDGIALHLIRPAAGSSGVSLHLYAKPIDQCRIYCPDTGRCEEIEMGYHSVRGEPCTKSPEAVRAEFLRS